jgi:DNA-binding NarL/FixJ family response regulator
MTKPRVVIADGQCLVAAGLQQLLASECDVVSTVYDGEMLLREVRRCRPDLVVQDISIPLCDGIELIREVRQIDPAIKVVVVTVSKEADLAARAFQAGASAYVLKNCAASELLEAVHCAMADRSYVTPLIAGGMIDALTARGTDRRSDHHLTPRQLEVLRLLAEGKSMKEIAAVLNLTVRTVAFHKYRMMQQLDIKTNAELVRFAVVQHIV